MGLHSYAEVAVIFPSLLVPTLPAETQNYLGPALALVGALFGGIGVKYVDKIFSLKEKKTDISFKIQDELRSEIKELKGTIRELDHQLDTVQRSYYKVLIKYNMLRERLRLPSDLEDEELDAKIAKLTSELDNKNVDAKLQVEQKKSDEPSR